MKKVLKWVAIGFVGLVVLGIIVGDGNKSDNGTKPATAASAPAKTTEEVAAPATTEDAPAPKPTVDVSLDGPQVTHQDRVTLKGSVTAGAKVRVNGGRAAVSGSHWTKVVTIKKRGENTYRVVATKTGYDKADADASVTRELSAEEKAVVRQEKAARRANGRALESAKSYLSMSGFSKKGLYEQLSSSAGEGFTQAEAQYAVDHVDADWNKEAVESARSYLDMSPMSRADLIEQLSSSAGEGFTYEQAVYAVDKVY
jgi:hypothetical protein